MQAALREVTGAYAIVVMCEGEPGVLVAARKGSPLMVGVGKEEYIIASDPGAIVAHTTQAITLDDYTVARLTRDSFRTTTIDNVPITPQVRELEFDVAIEDSIEMAAVLAAWGVGHVFLLDRPWNRDHDALPEPLRRQVRRVENWTEIRERLPE